jgi:hypothetical protein
MELLPKAPEWKFRTISIPGCATEQPIILYYRDSFEVLKMLLSNPLLAGRIDFDIRKTYSPIDSSREYSEWVTSDGAWFMQVRIALYYSGIPLTLFFIVTNSSWWHAHRHSAVLR